MRALPALHLRNGHWTEAARLIAAAVEDAGQVETAARQVARALRAEGVMWFRGRRG